MSLATIAAGRIAKALKDKGVARGYRGPEGEHDHVGLFSGDIVAACDAALPSQIVTDLRKGSAKLRPQTKVGIQCDDAYHLLDQVAAAAPPVEATPAPTVGTPSLATVAAPAIVAASAEDDEAAEAAKPS